MAGERHLWLWQYTDEFGKRVESSWLMSEEQAAHYKDAVKVEGLARDQEELGLDVLDSTSDLNRSPRTS